MPYRVELAPAAQRQIKKLPVDLRQRLVKAIEALSTNPRPDGVKKMQGEENLYRVRQGSYRIIYQIQDKALMVLVVEVGDRRDIYR